MPERGPAQLLLLFFPPRPRPGWKVGLAAASIALLAMMPGEEGVYRQAKDEIAQSLRQAAWSHALASGQETQSWPWSEAEPVPYSKISRLGLSAALLSKKSAETEPQQEISGHDSAAADRRDPHLAVDVDVEIGDQITVTRADGSHQSYRVTGWELFE